MRLPDAELGIAAGYCSLHVVHVRAVDLDSTIIHIDRLLVSVSHRHTDGRQATHIHTDTHTRHIHNDTEPQRHRETHIHRHSHSHFICIAAICRSSLCPRGTQLLSLWIFFVVPSQRWRSRPTNSRSRFSRDRRWQHRQQHQQQHQQQPQ